MDSNSKAEELAAEIMEVNRNQLLVHLRFLEPLFLSLPLVPDPEGSLMTDGMAIYYSFQTVINEYRKGKGYIPHHVLHMVLHDLYHHPFLGSGVEEYAWDLACDLAVEASILDLKLPHTETERKNKELEILAELRREVPVLTAERIYHYLREQDLPPEQLASLRDAFYVDDHKLWYEPSSRRKTCSYP